MCNSLIASQFCRGLRICPIARAQQRARAIGHIRKPLQNYDAMDEWVAHNRHNRFQKLDVENLSNLLFFFQLYFQILESKQWKKEDAFVCLVINNSWTINDVKNRGQSVFFKQKLFLLFFSCRDFTPLVGDLQILQKVIPWPVTHPHTHFRLSAPPVKGCKGNFGKA